MKCHSTVLWNINATKQYKLVAFGGLCAGLLGIPILLECNGLTDPKNKHASIEWSILTFFLGRLYKMGFQNPVVNLSPGKRQLPSVAQEPLAQTLRDPRRFVVSLARFPTCCLDVPRNILFPIFLLRFT